MAPSRTTASEASHAGSAAARRRSHVSIALAAAAIFALAYGSPVETVDSDPGIALLASQALLDHQSLRLDPYVGRAELAYELGADYRVRRYAGAYYPNSLGVPVLSAPAVWLANRAGLDMLDQRHEFALQNLLSAAACTVLFLLLLRLCRLYGDASSSLAIAAVSMLGTSLMSTGGTGLWNSDYSLIFTTLALHHLAARPPGRTSFPALGYLVALLVLGFSCRPSTAFFGLAVLIHLLRDEDRRITWVAAATLAGVGLAVAIPSMLPLPWMAAHYSPARLRLPGAVGWPTYGVLLSPSRGLFVFSPFLLLISMGGLRYFRELHRDHMFRLCASWIVLHVLAVATTAGKWWGGHSFGPRMLIDIIPGFVVLTCLVWRQVGRGEASAVRRSLALAYLALGSAAIAIHSGQALFNPATKLWNLNPNVDLHPELAMDWRFPQFLASTTQIEARLDDFDEHLVERRRATLPTYPLGTTISHDADEVIFAHWYAPENGWRWTRGAGASMILRLPEIERGRGYVLQMRAGTLGPQRVQVRMNGVPVATLVHSGFAPSWHIVAMPGELLHPRAENVIDLRVSDPSSTTNDSRKLGLALWQARLVAIPEQSSIVTFADDPYFADGFSVAEDGWRWTDGTQARLLIPVGSVVASSRHAVTIRARTLGRQRVVLSLNGVSIGQVTATRSEMTSITLPFEGALLQPYQANRLDLYLPDAASAPGDIRRLGLAVFSVTIAPHAEITPAR